MHRMSILIDEALFEDFKRLAEERGHTMTWYLTQSIKEVVERSRREEKEKGGDARQELRSKKRK